MWEETRHLKGGKILRSSSSTDQIDKLKEICGHLLRNYDWSNAEINDEGLPCCPACHEPLIGIWHDDAIFHEFPRLGEVFLADIGKPYLQACACQRALSAPSYAETLAMEEKPDRVEFTGTLEEDLARRDFTINAMAWDGRALIDPFGGREDNDDGRACV